jgi:mono/diheme cytochrome c family protein
VRLVVLLALAGAAAGTALALGREPPGQPAAQAPGQPAAGLPDAAALGSLLGCGACHGPPFAPSAVAAPPLADAGRKFAVDHLAAFIAAPVAVRPALEPARMPSFALDAAEAAAIAAYLRTLRRPDALPTAPRVRDRAQRAAAERLITTELGCLACHTLRGSGEGTAVELAAVRGRLSRAWVRALLIDPERVEPGTAMPALFYERVGDGYRERVPGSGARLDAVVDYLFEETSAPRAPAAPRADAEHGRTLVVALGCARCHTDLGDAASAVRRAPDLRRSAAAMRDEALRDYLREPHAVRPFGDPPGTGGRMPDFRLSRAEADTLAAWLRRQAVAPSPVSLPSPLPRYAHATAETLLRERLPCLGCHALDGQGGRIAPELGAVAARLEAHAIAAIIDDPAAHVPGSIMPRVPLSPYERRRVIGYLLARDSTAARTEYLSPLDHPLLPGGPAHARVDTGEVVYGRSCAACHGAGGQGDGFNARYLARTPTVHADAAYMRTRPDDALFDATAVGGRIMGRSVAMPMFGESLTAAELRALVSHMRTLCACPGPAWSEPR